MEVKGTNPRKDWFNGRFRNVLLTSIAVVPVQEHTVATLGTADGRVIQVRRNRYRNTVDTQKKLGLDNNMTS